MNQGKLFDLGHPDMPPVEALSHAADPATSHEAARSHAASGNRLRNAAMVLRVLCEHGGYTATELWDAMTPEQQERLKEPQEVRRRLTDLLSNHTVRQGEARKCRVRGTKMVTWYAV